MQGSVDFHIHGRDEEESEDEEGAEPLRPAVVPLAALSRTDARNLGKAGLQRALTRYLLYLTPLHRHCCAHSHLRVLALPDSSPLPPLPLIPSRGASLNGNKPELLDRLLYLLDVEMEHGYTKGDVDVVNGVHPITLQMDNAKPHVGSHNIQKLNELGLSSGKFTIQCTLQPAKSPDLNKNDMSFFCSLASQASKIANVRNNSYEDIVCNVVHAFEDYPMDSLYRTYAETFAVYREILKNYGGNDFKMPHGEIRKNERNGIESANLYVEVGVVESARQWLIDNPLQNPDILI
jgi:hypothetical protein